MAYVIVELFMVGLIFEIEFMMLVGEVGILNAWAQNVYDLFDL